MIDRLQAEMKEALKAGDKIKLGVLRMTLSELKNAQISKGKELEEGEIFAVLQKAVKKREEAAEAFHDADREDQAAKEKAEAKILQEYLPQPLSRGELEKIVADVIAETGVTSRKDMGQVIKTIMSHYRGRVDGREVQALVTEKLP